MNATLELPLPLQELVHNVLWPNTPQACQKQNLCPLLSREVVQTFAPEEETIFFYPYPFERISDARIRNPFWNDARGALEEISPDLALILGDFGPGSDAAIILDYRPDVPRLLRLQWGESAKHWVDCGISVEELVELVHKHHATPAS